VNKNNTEKLNYQYFDTSVDTTNPFLREELWNILRKIFITAIANFKILKNISYVIKEEQI